MPSFTSSTKITKKIEIYESQKATATQYQQLPHAPSHFTLLLPGKDSPLSAYRNDRVKKPTYQFSLGKRTLLTKHQYLIYSYFMKQKSRIFSLNFPQMWWRFYIPATLLTCLLFWELLSLKDISNEVTKKRSREFKTLTYTLLPGNKKYTVRICCSCAETACLFCINATEDLNVTQDLKNYSYCFAVGHLHQPILSAKHHKAADFCPSFYLLLRKHQGKKKTKCI